MQGIDLSPDMVAQLQAKPGGDAIGVTIGDFATTVVDGTFRLAYLVYNTIQNLTSQDDQVACFANVGATSSRVGASSSRCGAARFAGSRLGKQYGRSGTPDTDRLRHIDVVPQRDISHHYSVTHGRLNRAHPVSLRAAGRVRPDGPNRRHAPARALGRLET